MTLQDELQDLSISGESFDDMEYVDVRVNGKPIATVQVKDGSVEVLAYDPEQPEDSHADRVFEQPEMDPEEELSRAEIEAERKLDERRERHFDRHGHF